MAGLTKEEREKREAEKYAALVAQITATVRAELEKEYKEKIVPETKTETKQERAKSIQKTKRIPLDTIVPVLCNTVGGAIYISKKSGDVTEWAEYGSVEYLSLSELSTMKNTHRRFFTDNWIVLEDTDEYTKEELYDFLKVSEYYENVVTFDEVEKLLSSTKEDVLKRIPLLSKGMKETVAVIADRKLKNNELDKNLVDALQETLGFQFV